MRMQQNSSSESHLPIVEYIIEGIQKGRFVSSSKIPSETDLLRQFACSRYNVRQALGRLEKLGWITTVQGKGSYVRPRPLVVPYRVTPNTRFTDNMERAGKSHHAQLLEWRLGLPTGEEAKHLLLAARQQVYRLEILRSVEGVPISITTSTLPEVAVPVLERHLGEFSSLYAILESHYHFRPLRVITAVYATAAKSRDASSLKMPTEVAILRTESLMYHPAGFPVEYSLARARGDMCHLHFDFGSVEGNERGDEEREASHAKLSRQ